MEGTRLVLDFAYFTQSFFFESAPSCECSHSMWKRRISSGWCLSPSVGFR